MSVSFARATPLADPKTDADAVGFWLVKVRCPMMARAAWPVRNSAADRVLASASENTKYFMREDLRRISCQYNKPVRSNLWEKGCSQLGRGERDAEQAAATVSRMGAYRAFMNLYTPTRDCQSQARSAAAARAALF